VTVQVGDAAPAFVAAGTGGRTYSLADFVGRPVVLVFYPGDATPVCTEQLSTYTADIGQFSALDAAVLALSPQDVDSHERFTQAHGFAFPLLYDEDKQIGKQYGVVGPLGFYRRSIVVIGPDGRIAFVRRSTAGLAYTRSDEIIEAIRSLPSGQPS
jgi:peroxiredoxin Q/BCP